ncbi:MAG TPA: helix-turn-helix domain-containing protein [Mycobacteriales bacterium]
MERQRRSDAVRNRTAILAAARAVVRDRGAANLRVAEVARAAGVGAGSIYRAMGSRSGLLLALLDEDERELQERMIRGEPPIGPGAPPAERLEAFVRELHALVLRQREVLVAADDTAALAQLRSPVHAGWAAHLRVLISQLRPQADPVILAELVLGAVSAPTSVHLVDDLGRDPDAVLDVVLAMVRALVLQVSGPTPPITRPAPDHRSA